jgi:hypothetical protein
LPETADWLPDLEAELFAFPGGRHDDQCDSISQALFDKNVPFPMRTTQEMIAAIASRNLYATPFSPGPARSLDSLVEGQRRLPFPNWQSKSSA